ncbi:MAG TPA: hypothetical protein VJN18_32360 [Polyangiaceae bacterium]|nr:hypothetical protein [Polyangiaceae bacterium]
MAEVWKAPPIVTPRGLEPGRFDPEEMAVWCATFGAFVAHPPVGFAKERWDFEPAPIEVATFFWPVMLIGAVAYGLVAISVGRGRLIARWGRG